MKYSSILEEYTKDSKNDELTSFFIHRVINEYLKSNDLKKGITKLMVEQMTPERVKNLKELALQLDILLLFNQLKEMKVYYQINPDPRNPEIKSLYAKAVLPKFGKFQKRKMIGVHFGSLASNPKGWTESNMKEAKLELIDKGFSILTGE
jgi:hypothetical protein